VLQESVLSLEAGEADLRIPDSKSHIHFPEELHHVLLQTPETGSAKHQFITLKKVTVYFQVQPAIRLNGLVERMGVYGWRGRVLQVSDDNALVNWGSRHRWHPLYELYPLDESGRPILPGTKENIFQIARSGRITLSADYS
jgi:hypothetical protein